MSDPIAILSNLDQLLTIAFAISLAFLFAIRRDRNMKRAALAGLLAVACVLTGELAAVAASGSYRLDLSLANVGWFIAAKTVSSIGLCFALYAVYVTLPQSKWLSRRR